jgi:hypothetical protein
MNGSQIQQGTSQSTQTHAVSALDLDAVSKFIAELKDQLPNLQLAQDQMEKAEADITAAEAQLNSPKPKHSLIKECLKSHRSILVNASRQLIAVELLTLLSRIQM